MTKIIINLLFLLIVIFSKVLTMISIYKNDLSHKNVSEIMMANVLSLYKNSAIKIYKPGQIKQRYLTIIRSLNYIRQHNQLYRNGYLSHQLRANHFIDLSFDEISEQRFKNIENDLKATNYLEKSSLESVMSSSLNVDQLPSQFDWRQMQKVTKAKDQLNCKCCYAFTVIASIESAIAIRDNISLNDCSINLSEQQILDCSGPPRYQNQGCNYGYIEDSFQYVIDNGIVDEHQYPYKSQKLLCEEKHLKNHTFIKKFKKMCKLNSIQIKQIIKNKGPVIAPINNDGLDFLFYHNGILKTESNKNNFNHAVLIIGWGQQNYTDYWIVKNSWSEQWGENGFAQIQFGVRGIGQCIYYPILDDTDQFDFYNNSTIFVICLAIMLITSILLITTIIIISRTNRRTESTLMSQDSINQEL